MENTFLCILHFPFLKRGLPIGSHFEIWEVAVTLFVFRLPVLCYSPTLHSQNANERERLQTIIFLWLVWWAELDYCSSLRKIMPLTFCSILWNIINFSCSSYKLENAQQKFKKKIWLHLKIFKSLKLIVSIFWAWLLICVFSFSIWILCDKILKIFSPTI